MKDAQLQVLDHGYVTLVDVWGSDEGFIRAARMSTNKGFNGWSHPGGWTVLVNGRYITADSRESPTPFHYSTEELAKEALARWNEVRGMNEAVAPAFVPPTVGDDRLLAFLYRNKHMTPFEMGGATFEVQAPLFVFREWHRHRTQSFNEMSARYTPLPDVNYVPSVERIMLNAQLAGNNKQAASMSGALPLTTATALDWRDDLKEWYAASQAAYEAALASGVPKELARIGLPLGRYSRMRASANFRNWLQFLALRLAPDAQWEIRQYAQTISKVLATQFPRSMALFEEGRK